LRDKLKNPTVCVFLYMSMCNWGARGGREIGVVCVCVWGVCVCICVCVCVRERERERDAATHMNHLRSHAKQIPCEFWHAYN